MAIDTHTGCQMKKALSESLSEPQWQFPKQFRAGFSLESEFMRKVVNSCRVLTMRLRCLLLASSVTTYFFRNPQLHRLASFPVHLVPCLHLAPDLRRTKEFKRELIHCAEPQD